MNLSWWIVSTEACKKKTRHCECFGGRRWRISVPIVIGTNRRSLALRQLSYYIQNKKDSLLVNLLWIVSIEARKKIPAVANALAGEGGGYRSR